MKNINIAATLFAALLAAAVCAGQSMAAADTAPAGKQEKPKVSGQPAQLPVSSAQPALGGARSAQAEVKIEKLDLAAAVSEISLADPDGLAELYRVASEVYVRTQKIDKAISLLETYRRQGGTNQTNLYSLANLYAQRGANKEAVDVYETLLKLYPDNSGPTSTMLLTLYRQQGDLKKAAGLLEAGTKSKPDNPEAFAQLAGFYLEQGDTAKAEETLKKAADISPKPEYYKQLAQIYFQQNSLAKAVAALQEGIKKAPAAEAELTMVIGDLYLQTGQADKALAALEECVKKKPESVVELTFAISNIYVQKRETDKAEALLKGLLEKVSEPGRKETVQQRLNTLHAAAVPAPRAAMPALPAKQ